MTVDREISLDMKIAAHEIVFDAMIHTQGALNASLAILEITMGDSAFAAADEVAQALRHLSRASRSIYKMPASEEF